MKYVYRTEIIKPVKK